MHGPRLFVTIGVSFLLGSMFTSALSPLPGPHFTASGTENTCPCPEGASSASAQSPSSAPAAASSVSSVDTESSAVSDAATSASSATEQASSVETQASSSGIYDLAVTGITVRPSPPRASREATITVSVRNTGTLRTPGVVTVRLDLTNMRNARRLRRNLSAEVMDPGSTFLATPAVTIRGVPAFGDNDWHFPSDGRATVRACIEWALDTDATNNCVEITVQSGR